MTFPHQPSGGGPHSEPPPQAVPGFEDALRSRLLPSVPSSPPTPSVRPSAKSSLIQLSVTAALVVVALILVMVFGASSGRLGLGALGVLFVTFLVGIVLCWTMVKRWGKAVLAETLLGYTTSPFNLGRFWLRPAPGAPWTVGWVGWDFSGVWVLDAQGEVRAGPRPGVLAPGFYPSPHVSGSWELWTGLQWSNWVASAIKADPTGPVQS